MDRVSAALIMCILILTGINAAVIYNTWLKDDGLEAVEIYSQKAVDRGDFVFNDDTSIECISDKNLWIRAKLVYSGKYDAGKYEIVSEAASDGYWKKASDGWYYCSEEISMGEETRPLIDELLYEGNSVNSGSTGKFRLHVEAVDEAWLDETPANCRQAFTMLEKIYSAQDIKELL